MRDVTTHGDVDVVCTYAMLIRGAYLACLQTKWAVREPYQTPPPHYHRAEQFAGSFQLRRSLKSNQNTVLLSLSFLFLPITPLQHTASVCAVRCYGFGTCGNVHL